MRSKTLIACLAASLIVSTPAASAQSLVDCDDLRRGAQDAQLRYIQAYQPRMNPVQTFDLATGSCLEFIANFDIGFSLTIPSLGDIDAFLRRMAMALLLRACQMATDQFNKAVNDAVNTIKDPINNTLDPLNTVPGVSAGVTTKSSSGVGGSVSGTVGTDGGSTVRRTVENASDRVINFVK